MAFARNTVRAHELLGGEPDRGLSIVFKHSFREPLAVETPRLVGDSGSVRWTTL